MSASSRASPARDPFDVMRRRVESFRSEQPSRRFQPVSIRFFAGRMDKITRFTTLINNLFQLASFKPGQKPSWNKNKKTIEVCRGKWRLTRHLSGSFHPNRTETICRNTHQCLLAGQKVINKIIETEGIHKWRTIQKVFFEVRPFYDDNKINAELCIALCTLSPGKYQTNEIWSLLKAGIISQIILPLIGNTATSDQQSMLPLRSGYEALISTYGSGWIHDGLVKQAATWPQTLQNIAAEILNSQESPGPECAFTGQQSTVAQSGLSSKVVKVNSAEPDKKPVIVDSRRLRLPRPREDELQKEFARRSSIDPLKAREEQVRLRQTEQEKAKALQDGRFNSLLNRARALEGSSHAASSSDVSPSDSSIDASSKIDSIRGRQTAKERSLVRTESESFLHDRSLWGLTTEERVKILKKTPSGRLIGDIEMALRDKFIVASPYESDKSEDDNWSDEDTKPGYVKTALSYIGLGSLLE